MKAPINRMLRWKEVCGAAVEPGCVCGIYRATDKPISVPGLRIFRTGDSEWLIAAPNRESAEELANAITGSQRVRPLSQEQQA